MPRASSVSRERQESAHAAPSWSAAAESSAPRYSRRRSTSSASIPALPPVRISSATRAASPSLPSGSNAEPARAIAWKLKRGRRASLNR